MPVVRRLLVPRLAAFAVAVGGLSALGAPLARGDECWLETPAGYQRMGGARWLGPYGSRREADDVNGRFFAGQGSVSCTTTPPPPPPPPPRTDKGVVALRNDTGHTVHFSLQRRAGGAWHERTLEAGGRWGEWQTEPAAFSVAFDHRYDDGYQEKRYALAHATVEKDAPTADDGRCYAFVATDGGIDLYVCGPARPPDDVGAQARALEARALVGEVNVVRAEVEDLRASISGRRFATSWMRNRVAEHGRRAERFADAEAALRASQGRWVALSEALGEASAEAAAVFRARHEALSAHLGALAEAGVVPDAAEARARAAAEERALVAARPPVRPRAPDLSAFPPDEQDLDEPLAVAAVARGPREVAPSRPSDADVARLARLRDAEAAQRDALRRELAAVPYDRTLEEVRAAAARTRAAREAYVARDRAVQVLLEETQRRLLDTYVDFARTVAVDKATAWLEERFPPAWRQLWREASDEVRSFAAAVEPYVDAFRRMRAYDDTMRAQVERGGLVPALLAGVAAARSVHADPALADRTEAEIRRAWRAMGDRLMEIGLPEPVHAALRAATPLLADPPPDR